MQTPTETLNDTLLNQLQSQLNFIPHEIHEINAGQNNRLFLLTDSKNKKLFVKFYYKDDRDRLNREFEAYKHLREKGFKSVPDALLKNEDEYFGVYSFEDGHAKPVQDYTKSDIDKCVDFIIALENLNPSESSYQFQPTVMGCLSLSDYIRNITFRLEKFNKDIDDGIAESQQIIDFAKKINLTEEINGFIAKATSKLTEEDINRPLDIASTRFNPGDFGPQNTLFREDQSVCFVDFEYFGWDDPARIVANFLQHDQTSDLSDDLKKYFLERYKSSTSLPQHQIDRLEAVLELAGIEWLTIHLFAISKDKLDSRKFADPNFNLEEYVKIQIEKATRRLQQLREIK